MTTALAQVEQKEATLLQALRAQEASLVDALPAHLDAKRLTRVALIESRRNPKLLECTVDSFAIALLQCAQVGLEPGALRGHAYLIPYGREVTFQMGYKGFLELLARTKQYGAPEVKAVYVGDTFSYQYGLRPDIVHVQKGPSREAKNLTHVYIIVRPKDGSVPSFDVMSREEIDAVRRRSKAGGSGPWVTDYVAMALKSVIRRHLKYLSTSVEMLDAVAFDEAAEFDADTGEPIGQDKADRLNAKLSKISDTASTLAASEAPAVMGEPSPTVGVSKPVKPIEVSAEVIQPSAASSSLPEAPRSQSATSAIEAAQEGDADPLKLTPDKYNALKALARGAGWKPEDIGRYCELAYSVKVFNELTKDQYEELWVVVRQAPHVAFTKFVKPEPGAFDAFQPQEAV